MGKQQDKVKIIKRTSHKQGQEIKEGDYETPKGRSDTIQDDTVSIQEMFNRMATVPSIFEPHGGTGLDEIDDFDSPDLMKIGRADVNTQQRISEKVRKDVETLKDQAIKAKKKAENKDKPKDLVSD